MEAEETESERRIRERKNLSRRTSPEAMLKKAEAKRDIARRAARKSAAKLRSQEKELASLKAWKGTSHLKITKLTKELKEAEKRMERMRLTAGKRVQKQLEDLEIPTCIRNYVAECQQDKVVALVTVDHYWVVRTKISGKATQEKRFHVYEKEHHYFKKKPEDLRIDFRLDAETWFSSHDGGYSPSEGIDGEEATDL